MKRLICLMMMCASGVGCSALNVKNPTATVTSMAVQGINASGFTMNFDVNVANPNSVALPLSAAEYKIGLGGVNVLDGKAKPEGSIPAGGSKALMLPVTLTYENLLAAEQAILKGGGDVPYALDGALVINTGNALLGSVRVPIQYKGQLAIREIINNPQAIMQSPAAQKLAKELLGGIFSR